MRLPVMGLVAAIFASAASAQTETVYQNSLASGWENWSWDTTINFSNASPARGGSGTSISVQYTAGWAGLYLHTNALVDTSTHVKLRFAIHGGTSGGQPIRLAGYNASGGEGGSIVLTPPAAGTWTVVEVPTSTFASPQLSGLVWQDNSANPQSAFYLDDIEWVLGTPPPPGPGPALTIDAGHINGRISPDIYGMNYASAQLAQDVRLPVRRWGGNATTRYNWQLDLSNRGMDWYYENVVEDSAPGSAADHFVDQDRSTNTKTLMTIPLIGFTPTVVPNNPTEPACGFRISKYGAQTGSDSQYRPDCGNGVKTSGGNVTGNNPLDTGIAIGPSFVQTWIAHFISLYGTAAAGGVKFYNLDNEPMLWNDTHRDVHPQATSFDEMRDRTWQYAAAIKATDPGAQTLGPVLYGWTAYFYSALDWAPGGSWWTNPQDRNAHGGVPFIEWYLQQMKAYELAHGVRILDYVDVHNYPEANDQSRRVGLRTAGDAEMQTRRLRSTRSLWDPTYVDESWIGEAVRLIPRMRQWVTTNYPGTKLAITEYNWGGLEDINGALAEADILGIFGREGLDLATLWEPPTATQPGAFAFRMYRNYDGAGAAFGDRRVTASSADQGLVSVYAARTGTNRLTVVAINKQSQASTCALNLSGISPVGAARVYRYSTANLGAIVQDTDLNLSPPVQLTLPANSIALLAIDGQHAPADLDADGDVDSSDLTIFLSCRTRAGMHVSPACHSSDLDGDGDVDASDFGRFQRCYAGTDVIVSPTCGGGG